jgi:hypothetical protein
MDGGPGGGDSGGGDGAGATGLLEQLPPEVIEQLAQAAQTGQLQQMLAGLGGGGGGMDGAGGGMAGALGMGGAGGAMGGAGGAMGGAGGAMGGAGGAMGGAGMGGMQDPSGAAGPGAGPAAGGEELPPEMVDDQLVGATQDMDLSPQELEGMAANPGAKMAAWQRQYLTKIASRVRDRRRSGKYDSTKAASPQERQLRDEVKAFLAEVCQAAG